MGLLEPINTRITDPQYFLDSPQQGRTPSPVPPPVLLILVPSSGHTPPPGFSPAAAILQKVGRPNLQLQMVREERKCF